MSQIAKHTADPLDDPAANEIAAGCVRALEVRVERLEGALRAMSYLAHPQIERVFQSVVGGLDFVPGQHGWRARGFYHDEIDPKGTPVLWSNPDTASTIDFFLLGDELYVGMAEVALTPNVETGSLEIALEGEPLEVEREGGEFSFRFRTRHTGWHRLSLRAPVLYPKPESSPDRRKLGFLLLSVRLRPVR